MTLLPLYSDDLAATAERLAVRRVATRRRGRMTALVATAVVVIGGGAAAATTLWNPQLGGGRRGVPAPSASAPPAAQLAALGVLRRDATDADHGDQTRYALSLFSPQTATGIRTDYVRLVGTDGDVLVPAAQAGGKSDALCLFARDPVDGGGLSCFTLADVLAGRALVGMTAMAPAGPAIPGPTGGTFQRVAPAATGPTTLTGLVPDGVAQVRLDGVTAGVHDNFFTLVEQRVSGSPSLDWLDASGRVLAH